MNRERALFEGEIANKKSASLKHCFKMDKTHRHYWMIQCKIDGVHYKINKNNAEADMYDNDKKSTPTFVFQKSSHRFYVTMKFKSGTKWFWLTPGKIDHTNFRRHDSIDDTAEAASA